MVVRSVVGELLAGRCAPQSGDDGQLLFESGELLFGEGDSVCRVFLLEPARAQAQFDPAARHLVDLRDLDGEDARQSEGACRHEGAEPEVLGLACETGECDPGVGGAGKSVCGAHPQVVVGAEEGVEAEVFGRLGDGQQCVVAGPLLGLGEDSKIHGSILHLRAPVVRASSPGPAPSPVTNLATRMVIAGILVAHG